MNEGHILHKVKLRYKVETAESYLRVIQPYRTVDGGGDGWR